MASQTLYITANKSHVPAQYYMYVLAGIPVVSAFEIPAWAAYKTESPLPDDQPEVLLGGALATAQTQTRAWVNGAWRVVTVQGTAAHQQLSTVDLASCTVITAPKAVVIDVALPNTSRLALEQSLLGVALMLSLPSFARWPLHAGSLALDEKRAVGFIGVSGAGKSTLTTYLAQHSAATLIGDDVAIAQQHAAQIVLRPQFPQLKLPLTVARCTADAVPLRRLYLLKPVAADAAVSSRPISGHQPLMLAVRHTIAAKLYGASAAAHHLAFCNHVAQRVTFATLNVPHALARLPDVQRYLAQEWANL